MKFVCDSCHAQYMISDDKVGANGVKVRCKKCSNVIVVKKAVEPDPTMVMQNPLANAAPAPDAPFAGLDTDEIGQAFDNVLSSGPSKSSDSRPPSGNDLTAPGFGSPSSDGFPMAASSSEDSDRDSTRVMDLKAIAGLAAQSGERTVLNELPDAIKAQGFLDGPNKPKNEVNGHANGSNGATVPLTDWYVAIDEEQKGPMTLDEVKGHWEAGKVTSDSLVWRNGYSDWKPLSTVSDLVKVLTPLPTPRKAPEKKAEEPQSHVGATASGPQLPASVAPAPAAVPDPDEVDWKPAAASALASLVAEEMEALSKPAPKPRAEPVGVGEGTNTGLKPVFDMPSAPAPEPVRASAPVLEPASRSLPRAPAHEPESDPEPMVRHNAYPSSQDVPVYPAPAAYVPPAPTSNNLKYIIAGGAFVVLCLTALGITFVVTSHKDEPARADRTVALAEPPRTQPQPVAAQPVAQPQPVAAQPVAQPQPAAQPVAQPAPQPVAQPAAQPQPVAVKPVAQPVAQPAPQPIPVAEPMGRGKHGKHGREMAMAAGQQQQPQAAPEPPPTRVKAESSDDLLAAGKGSKVDDDFDRLLGSGGKSEEAPAPSKKKSSAAPYIPPSITQNLPEQLGQGDIMSVVAGHKDQIKNCINQQRAKDPDSSGTVKMHWTIQKSGGVSGVSVGSDEFRGSPMGTCMGKAISGWKFPQFSGAPMPIDFPFKF